MNVERIQQPKGESGHDGLRFPHVEVEMKWINRWSRDKLYAAHDDSSKPKYYVLDMYPYPSGSGLHVGHVEGYTATDTLARYKRMKGFEVLHPMGWDAFGLPTENYAIKTGEDPHDVTARNADTFRRQCIRTGLSIDWDREIDTSREEYYKWTQQLFVDLFKNGLAYKEKAPANWCIGCNTVIANEQVQQANERIQIAHCERCDSPIESRNIEQWFFRITAYADRLIADLDGLDWPESTKEGQKNWIGKTEGTEVEIGLESNQESMNLFMTEPELLYGASFITVAPEYPDIDKIVTDDRKGEVKSYISGMIPQGEIERKKQKNKTGVFTGNYAINPLTGDKMPIWVAEHVVLDESGGVKVGVPSEFQVDRDFALAHGLQIIPVFEDQQRDSRDERIMLFGKYAGETQHEARKKILEDLDDKAKPSVKYKLRDWLISRERYWGAPIPMVHCESCGDQPIPEDQLPVLLPKLDDFTPTGVPPLAKSEEFLHTTCPNCNGEAVRETKTLDTFVDSSWYFMRFADPNNNDSMASENLLDRWLPVDYYVGGADHTTGHLLYSRFVTKALHDAGRIGFDEPFITLKHIGMVLGEDGRKMSKRWGNTVNPDDVSNEYGSDTLRLYETFMGPLEQSKVWDTKAIVGPRRFIDKIWQIQQRVDENPASPEETEATNTLIENISTAIESSKFNTAVSEFMKYLNTVDKSGRISRHAYETFLKLLAPLAPFITEELWERLGNKYSIHQASWPEPIAQEGIVARKQIPVMINGRFRGTISETDEMGDEEILELLRSDPRFAEMLTGVKVKRIINKPSQVFNIVT